MDEINKFIKTYGHPTGDGSFWNTPRVVCNDGFSMSVQASKFHYCAPRETNAFPYGSVEIGFPSRRIPEAEEYAGDKKRHTRTVFGYVPVKIVNEIIKKHGGIKANVNPDVRTRDRDTV